MEWHEIPSSSTIDRFAYDSESQVLTVEFKKGGTYQYFDIPANVYEELKSATSAGQFLARHIKGSYRYAKV